MTLEICDKSGIDMSASGENNDTFNKITKVYGIAVQQLVVTSVRQAILHNATLCNYLYTGLVMKFFLCISQYTAMESAIKQCHSAARYYKVYFSALFKISTVAAQTTGQPLEKNSKCSFNTNRHL